MSLFSYLNYDGSYTDNILLSVKILTNKQLDESELNARLDSNNGVYYLTSALKAVKSPEEAEYMILDTHLPIVSSVRASHDAELGDTACICISKQSLVWQGGFVSTYKKLVEHICFKNGNTPKLKKACKANVSLYIAAAKQFMNANPEVLEQFIEEEKALLEKKKKAEDAESESTETPLKKVAKTVKNNKTVVELEEVLEGATEDNGGDAPEVKAVKKTSTTTKKTTVVKKTTTKSSASSGAKEDKPIYISDDVADYVKRYMLDENPYWTLDNIKLVLWRTILVALKSLDNKKTNACVANDKYILVNSGFIADDYEYIMLVGELFYVNDEALVKSVDIVRTKDDLTGRGFGVGVHVPTLLDAVVEKVDAVDFTDRGRMVHCIEERGFRIGLKTKDMTTVGIRSNIERLKASVDLALSLERKGIKMFAPFCYFNGNGQTQFMVPVYKSLVPKLDAPDGAMIIGKKNGVWEVETVVELKTALSNVVVIDKYVNTPWLSIARANTY